MIYLRFKVVAQKDFTNSMRKLIRAYFPQDEYLTFTEYVKIDLAKTVKITSKKYFFIEN
jgi:hypothetical protein